MDDDESPGPSPRGAAPLSPRRRVRRRLVLLLRGLGGAVGLLLVGLALAQSKGLLWALEALLAAAIVLAVAAPVAGAGLAAALLHRAQRLRDLAGMPLARARGRRLRRKAGLRRTRRERTMPRSAAS